MPRRRHDPNLAAARYAIERDIEADDDAPSDAGTPTPDQRAAAVEVAIQQAMRRGDFENLPGSGTPIQGLGAVRDPDWWIRRKIEREGLTGLGPPALTLRTEDAALDGRLDELHSEDRVREVLGDFNRRVRQARLQLLGGPPVLTEPRDLEAEVAAWRRRAAGRREQAQRRAEEERRQRAEALAAMSRRERRRARRA